MKDILVIVGNASRARIFRVRGGVLELLETLDHPESRARNAQLTTDRPGRSFNDTSAPHRSGMEPPTAPHEVELQSFARELARRVSIQARRGHLPDLLIMAPPRFLGRVKAALEPVISARIVATVSHDYTLVSEGDLLDTLQTLGVRAALPSPA